MNGVEYALTYVLEENIIFDLSNNKITQEIPSSKGNHTGLRLLNLSINHLEGKILASFSKNIYFGAIRFVQK